MKITFKLFENLASIHTIEFYIDLPNMTFAEIKKVAFENKTRTKDKTYIIVVGLAAGDGGVSCDAEIGTDPVNLGKNAAEALVKAIPEGEPINVCTMQTLLTSTPQNNQRQAFEDRLKELRPEAKVISYEECDSSAAKAVDKLSALYLAHPELNGVVSFDI